MSCGKVFQGKELDKLTFDRIDRVKTTDKNNIFCNKFPFFRLLLFVTIRLCELCLCVRYHWKSRFSYSVASLLNWNANWCCESEVGLLWELDESNCFKQIPQQQWNTAEKKEWTVMCIAIIWIAIASSATRWMWNKKCNKTNCKFQFFFIKFEFFFFLGINECIKNSIPKQRIFHMSCALFSGCRS